jgi:hypothetical protein
MAERLGQLAPLTLGLCCDIGDPGTESPPVGTRSSKVLEFGLYFCVT